MTVSASELADALRGMWLGLGAAWLGYSWLHRMPYARVFWGVIGLFALDWLAHRAADFAERPDSNLPSDFALYSLGLTAAALAGLGVALVYGRWRGISPQIILAAALLCVAGGAVAGRAQFVWSAWDYFAENTDSIADLATGGLSWRGALLTGCLVLFLFARVTRQSFWLLADAAALGAALAASIGWYTAHLTHLYYGLALDETPPAMGIFQFLAQPLRAFGFNFVQDLPDAYNMIALRIPIQLMASLYYLCLFGALLILALREKTRARAGGVFIVFLACAAAGGFVAGFWRGDATIIWNGLRVDQWLDLLTLLGALALAARAYGFTRARNQIKTREARLRA